MNQLDKLLEEGKFDEAITNQTRKVKWLFNNSNKLTNVVCEKTVRLIVHKLKERTERKDNVGVWIDVKDRLPKFNKNVLALSKKGKIRISYVDRGGNLDDFELEVNKGDYYTHWM